MSDCKAVTRQDVIHVALCLQLPHDGGVQDVVACLFEIIPYPMSLLPGAAEATMEPITKPAAEEEITGTASYASKSVLLQLVSPLPSPPAKHLVIDALLPIALNTVHMPGQCWIVLACHQTQQCRIFELFEADMNHHVPA